MARTATKAPVKKGKAPVKEIVKQKKTQGDDDLASLVSQNMEMEGQERAKTAGQASFISLIKANSGALDKNNPSYIAGLKPLEYAITSKKLKLGKTLDATIVGMFKVYAEIAPKEKDSDMARTVSFWHPDDASQYPVVGLFDRELPSGNILQPCHWIFLYLHDHPEIEDGIISFRSKGNTIYAQLEKLVKSQSTLCTELRFNISSQGIANDKYKKTDYYPSFELTGHNYIRSEDGSITKPKDSKVDKATLQEILARSNKLYSDYGSMKLIGRKQASITQQSRPALVNKGAYQDDEEDENVNF